MLLIGSEGSNIIPVKDRIPIDIKQIPVILAIKSPPLTHIFSAKMMEAKSPIQKIFIHPSATISKK
jgi:hypothetical protein